jgi:D-arabinose 1-dehydrogenase-like Zn-dependent alcohol dehydrogenase
VDGEGHRRAVRGLIRQVITADVEVISIEKVNEAYERMVKSDVKYRFSIDMASLKSE